MAWWQQPSPQLVSGDVCYRCGPAGEQSNFYSCSDKLHQLCSISIFLQENTCVTVRYKKCLTDIWPVYAFISLWTALFSFANNIQWMSSPLNMMNNLVSVVTVLYGWVAEQLLWEEANLKRRPWKPLPREAELCGCGGHTVAWWLLTVYSVFSWIKRFGTCGAHRRHIHIVCGCAPVKCVHVEKAGIW